MNLITGGFIRLFWVILSVAFISCKKDKVSLDQQVKIWLTGNVVPLYNADPTFPEQGFAALQEIIGESRIVGLGEATHGTTEFWGMRQKISQYLISEMGFTAILMEAGLPNSVFLNNYITQGEGTAEEAHQKLGVWRYQEMRNLIDWMREYNVQYADTGTTIQYFGYDCAFHNWDQATALISEYLQTVDPAAVTEITDRLSNYTTDDAEYVIDYLSSHKDQFINAGNQPEYELILRIAENLVPNWTVWYNLRNNLPDLDIRDEFNFGNVCWIIEQLLGKGKVIIWAHNGHVGNTILSDNQNTEAQMLGARLKIKYGAEYYVIATEFFGGQFLAWDSCEGHEYLFITQQAATPKDDSYAYKFDLAGIPLFYLDLSRLDYSLEKTGWLTGPLKMRFIGANYCPEYDREYYNREVSLPQEYDGIIFFENTHPANPVSF